MGAFKSPMELPYPNINLANSEGFLTDDNHGLLSIAEVGTLQLEFKYLSHLTDDDKYWDAAERVMKHIRHELHVLSGSLAPMFLRCVEFSPCVL